LVQKDKFLLLFWTDIDISEFRFTATGGIIIAIKLGFGTGEIK